MGKNRATVSAEHLTELNPYVPIKVLEGELSEEVLDQFSVVVLTNNTLKEALRINDFTRSAGKALIFTQTHGLFGCV